MNKKVMDTILEFRNERDWEKFHTPENLAKSIAIESGELLEHFQWGDDLDKEALEKELADVIIYSFLMAHAIEVDIESIILSKIEENKKKYPVDKIKGTSGRDYKLGK